MVRLFSALLLNACLLFSTLSAQDLNGKFNISPLAGVGIPMGEMANDESEAILNGDAAFRSTGYKFGINAEYFLMSNLGVGLDFLYIAFGSKDFRLMGVTIDSRSTISAIIFGAHLKYIFIPDGRLKPYAMGGMGIYGSTFEDVEGIVFDVEEFDRIDVDIDTELFAIFGGGLMYFISPRISLFGELTLDYAMTDGATVKYDDLVLGEIGENYYFIDMAAGINIWFGGIE